MLYLHSIGGLAQLARAPHWQCGVRKNQHVLQPNRINTYRTSINFHGEMSGFLSGF